MFQALRVPDFRLLWGGGLVSSLGSWLLVLAVPAHVLAATGSLRDTGLTLAAQYLPRLALGPVAGAVADGLDRRRLMIGANLFCAGAVAVMLPGVSPGRYWVLYAALIAENSGTVLYTPALQARMPAIVGTGPLLSSANSLTSASSGIVRLIGGPLGGVLLAVCGIRWLICADAFSYLLAAAAVFLTSRSGDGRPGRDALVSTVAQDLAEGARVLRAQPVARALLPVTVVSATANASLSAVLIPFGIQRLGGSEHTGLLLSCLGAGFLLGAPVIRVFLDRAEPRNLLTASLTATAVAYFLLFTSSSLAAALPAAAAVAMSGSMSLVIQQTTLQRVIPGTVLGRVSAVFLTGEAAATLTGSVAGPFLAQAAHLVTVAATASLVTLGAAALAFFTVPRHGAVSSRVCSASLRRRRRASPAFGCCANNRPALPESGSGTVPRLSDSQGPNPREYPVNHEAGRDHRDVNQDLPVFATDPLAGAGLPLWLPDGAVIRDELQRLAKDLARADGCQGVYSPVLGKRALFERSGHWAKFSDDMFPPMAVGGDELVLRPANCPHHALIYSSVRRSYRDLPVRFNELGAMFRAERSGVLSGLSRVRQINLDDTHVFCRPDQVAAEAARALRTALRAQEILGLPVDYVRLSRRDDGPAYLGGHEQWKDAEAALRAAAETAGLAGRGLRLADAPGEAAFYGPKLDLQVRDGRGHEESIATVQLDFNQPERFNLTYDAADGTRQRVMMIHRGTVGSMERVTAALLEHHQGRLPLWLAPVHVCVLPVGTGHDPAARRLVDDLIAAGLRPRLETAGSVAARVRSSRQRRDHLIAVVGDAEVAEESVQVTDVSGGFRGSVKAADFISLVRGAYENRMPHVPWETARGCRA